jgi:hypothetical protein
MSKISLVRGVTKLILSEYFETVTKEDFGAGLRVMMLRDNL